MARNHQRLEFSDFQDLADHLDQWARERLADPAAWEDTLIVSRSWLDYSPRNQILLASYGVDGPVAGPETWRLVPSTTEGRGCAVRSGEHGWPVCVPMTTGGAEPDPYLGGHRPTRAEVQRWEWRPVFEVAQLARRPAPDSLIPIELPATLRGSDSDAVLMAAVRKVAGATVRGKLPSADDPADLLVAAAARLRRSKRPALDDTLRAQVAWLVTDRVGHARGDRPTPFDPGSLKPRERWQVLWDVLEPARKLTAALGKQLGVNLVASPLPRMEIVDDRVVPAGRRNRLPAASLEQLPIGRWVTVGPYTPVEWAARGEPDGAGNGAFLRLNKHAYLSAVETGDGASWRLEDVASRTGHGLLAAGQARSLDDARAAAVGAVRSRYPALATEPPSTAAPPGGSAPGWEKMVRDGQAVAAEMWQLDDQITLLVLPGPGGRWQPAIQAPSSLGTELLPLQRSIDDARTQAELAGRRLARVAAVADPARADHIVATVAVDSSYSRRELAAVITPMLRDSDPRRVETATPAELVELLGDAGLSPATTVAVLAADGIDAATAAELLPHAGVPTPDAIRVLEHRWQLDRVAAAGLLGATAAEMRTAGCTPVEIMASRPRDVLRTLAADPHLWDLAAGTMVVAGHSTATVAAHLVAHAPTPDAFATGLAAIADPADGLTLAARYQAHPDQLAAASEHYGLSPGETADVLIHLTPPATMLDVVALRCDGSQQTAAELAASAGVDATAIAEWLNPSTFATVTPIRSDLDLDATALLEALPTPDTHSTLSTDTGAQLDPLTAIEPTAPLEPAR